MSQNSNSLFSTNIKDVESLIQAINEGFPIQYSAEIHPEIIASFSNSDGPDVLISDGTHNEWRQTRYLHIPLVKFSDRKLATVREHLIENAVSNKRDFTGLYAIGLSKKWAKKKGVNPVHYLVPGGQYAADLAGALKPTKEKIRVSDGRNEYEPYFPPKTMGSGFAISDNKGNSFPKTYLYVKALRVNYRLPNGSLSFVDNQAEQEWRYIPQDAAIIEGEVIHGQTTNQYLWASIQRNVERAKEEANRHAHLPFDADDINLIVVDKDSEISAVREALTIRFPNLAANELNALLAKVNSYESLSLSRDF